MKANHFIPLVLVALFTVGIPAGALASEEPSQWSEDVEVVEYGGVQYRVGIDDTE